LLCVLGHFSTGLYTFDKNSVLLSSDCEGFGSNFNTDPMAKPKLIIDVKPWSTMELFDLRLAVELGQTIEMTAALLGREVEEVMRKAEELGLIQSKEQQY
jgi:hypothetical protein